MYDMMKKQNFGIEIELTGITRKQAAQVIADYFGTEPGYAGTYYNTYTATDRQGRIWKAMSDGSIRTERKAGKERMAAGRERRFPTLHRKGPVGRLQSSSDGSGFPACDASRPHEHGFRRNRLLWQ